MAQFATDEAIVGLLYKRGQAETADSSYGKALRLACLANPRVFDYLAFTSGKAIDKGEVEHLAREGEDEEIRAMLQNPSAGWLIASLFNRKAPFDTIPEERRCRLVSTVPGNPRINIDESDEGGPDMEIRGIHRGIFNLLATAPLTEDWIQALHRLLSDVSPHTAKTPDSDPQPAIARWTSDVIKKSYGENKGEDQEGHWTGLSLVDEFRCMIAALYGSYYNDKSFKERVQLGGPNDSDIALRCAFYGNGKLTVEQMKAAHERDSGAFVLSALTNMNVYYSNECRAAVEEMLNEQFFWLYKRRLEQIRTGGRLHRDLRPLTEYAAEIDEDRKPPSDEMTTLTRIEARVDKIEERIREMWKYGFWWAIALLAVVLFLKH